LVEDEPPTLGHGARGAKPFVPDFLSSESIRTRVINRTPSYAEV
jgi:hypothetical protein